MRRLFVATFWASVMTAAVAAPNGASAESPDREALIVYQVDLRQAVLQLRRGRQVKATLERIQRFEEQQVRRMEAALVEDQPQLTSSAYRQRFEAIQRRIDAAARKLEDEQVKLLEPILTDLRAVITDVQSKQVVVLEVGAESPLGLEPECDRTKALVAATKSAARPARQRAFGAPTAACRFDGLLFVDFDRVVQALPAGQAAVARLDALQKKRQAELEAHKKRLVEVERQARVTGDPRWREEVDQRSRQLDETFRKYQLEIQRAERDSQSALYDRVERALVAFRAKNRGLLFVEYDDDRPARDRSCEVTEWVAARVEGLPADLTAACPWVR